MCRPPGARHSLISFALMNELSRQPVQKTRVVSIFSNNNKPPRAKRVIIPERENYLHRYFVVTVNGSPVNFKRFRKEKRSFKKLQILFCVCMYVYISGMERMNTGNFVHMCMYIYY